MPNYQSFVGEEFPEPSGATTIHRTKTHNIQIRNNNDNEIAAGQPISLGGWFGESRRRISKGGKGTLYMQGGEAAVSEIDLPDGWSSSIAAGQAGFINPSNGQWSQTDGGGFQPVRAIPKPDMSVAYDDPTAAADPDSKTVFVALVTLGTSGNPDAPFALSYGGDIATGLNTAIDTTPTVSGGATVTYSVTPALPAGLTLDTDTGELAGQSAVPYSGSHRITAVNLQGSASDVVQIDLSTANAGVDAAWPLTEASGTRFDKTSNAFHLTQTGGVGLDGSAASFDGVDDVLTVTAAAAPDLFADDSDFTIGLKARVDAFTAVAGAKTPLVAMKSSTAVDEWAFVVAVNKVNATTGQVVFLVSDGSATFEAIGPQIQLGIMTGIICQFKNDEITVYVDGVAGAVKTLGASGVARDNAADLRVGAYTDDNGTNVYFDGAIKDVVFWNRALIVGEVAIVNNDTFGYGA